MVHPDQTAEEYRKESSMWELILMGWPIWQVVYMVWRIVIVMKEEKKGG